MLSLPWPPPPHTACCGPPLPCSYADSARWRLALSWPVLAVISKRFRTQFMAALKGRRFTQVRGEGEGTRCWEWGGCVERG